MSDVFKTNADEKKNPEIMDKDVNEVSLRGAIMHIHSTPKVTLVVLSTRDYTKNRLPDGKYFSNYPTITFFDKQGEEIAKNYKKYDSVSIEAIVQNTYNHADLTGRQEYWGLSMEQTKNTIEMLTEGTVKGNFHSDDKNEVTIAGKIANATVYGNWLRLSVRTQVDGYLSHNTVSMYHKHADKEILKYPKGTRVILVGQVQTVNTTKNGKPFKYESVVASDIAVLKLGMQPPKQKEKAGKTEDDTEVPEIIAENLVTEDIVDPVKEEVKELTSPAEEQEKEPAE